jgi:hypothetical protein
MSFMKFALEFKLATIWIYFLSLLTSIQAVRRPQAATPSGACRLHFFDTD